jgi:hypothetical protein
MAKFQLPSRQPSRRPKFAPMKMNRSFRYIRQLDTLTAPYVGIVLDAQRIQSLVELFQRVIKGADQRALFSSLSHLIRKKLSEKEMAEQVRLLCVNVPRLTAGTPVFRFSPNAVFDGWAMVQCTDVAAAGDQKQFVRLDFRIIWGMAYGRQFSKIFPATDLSWVNTMCYRIGLKRTESGLPRELVNMWMLAEIYTDLDANGPRLKFRRVASLPEISRRNRSINALRMGECPRGLESFCSQCQLGLDQCPAACRPVTITLPPKETQ